MLQILFFAAVAVLVLARLYQVLGQNRGAEPPATRPSPLPAPAGAAERRPLGDETAGEPSGDVEDMPFAPAPTGPGAAGLTAIMTADPGFSPDAFLNGARGAYEMIVTAFGAGDAETLKPLLTEEVFAVYEAEIAKRKEIGAQPIEVVRLSGARIADAEIEGRIARIDVAFSSDLRDGGQGLRATDETWTFERALNARDPNWRLSAVQA